uniref:Ig-like domain-containing protein n=1 Tax=Malurus cyaneus samueli TaxID=2593467 RepID=A0A8C5U7V1_9PASS
MASFNNFKNVLVLAFDWILYGAGTCRVTVTQPRFQEADSSVNNVSLPCTFSASGCSSPPPEVLWFRLLTNTHQDLCTPRCTDHQKYKVYSSEKNILLEIKDLTVEDNGVYICGIAFSDSASPLSKQTGDGTVLMVTGQLFIPS